MLLKLLKNKSEEVNVNLIIAYCDDVLRYLEEEIEEECKTNQHCVEMKEMFRGYVIKD